MSILPLNWPDKVDSPELLAWLQQFGSDKYIDSNQINLIRDALNELHTRTFDTGIFKKKIENSRWKSTQLGTNVVIPFQSDERSHYIVVNPNLQSVAGFSNNLLSTLIYEGKDVLFENQTGNNIILKDSYGTFITSFSLGEDLIMPNKGIIWFRVINGKLELILKSWSELNSKWESDNW